MVKKADINIRMKCAKEPPEQTGAHRPAKSPVAMFAGTPEELSFKCNAS